MQISRIASIFPVIILLSLGCSTEGPEETVSSRVFFIEPSDGATVESPVDVKMGVEGMEIRPISEGLIDGTGHHHILVNMGPRYPQGIVIPNDDVNRHFGGGQTEAELELEPGEYMLTLQFADAKHRSLGPAMSHSISITVK